MPYDGISFTEAGYKVTLPSELNIQAEMSSQAQAKTFIKKLDSSDKIHPDGKNKKNSDQEHAENKQGEEDLAEEFTSEFEKKSLKTTKFKVYFNQSIDMVEIIDKNTGKVVETISPNDLLSLVSKSKTASGILVDRRI